MITFKIMRKISVLIIAALTLTFFNSCTKQDEITVNLVQQGNLQVKFVDNNNNPLTDVKVALNLGMYSSMEYDTKLTDAEGLVDFGELLNGMYYIGSEDIEIAGRKYNVIKPIQVTTGLKETIIINVEEFVGDVELTINSIIGYSDIDVVANVNVVLFPVEEYSNELTHSDIINGAYSSGVTDEEGKLSLENVPAYTNYLVYVYFDEVHAGWSNSYTEIFVEKGGLEEVRIFVNKQDLYDIKGTFNIYAYYWGYNDSNVYGEYAIPNLNIALISDSDYYEHSLYYENLSTILDYAEFSGKTNESGDLSLEVHAYKVYYMVGYTDENNFSWNYYTNNVSEDRTLNLNVEFDEYDLNL